MSTILRALKKSEAERAARAAALAPAPAPAGGARGGRIVGIAGLAATLGLVAGVSWWLGRGSREAVEAGPAGRGTAVEETVEQHPEVAASAPEVAAAESVAGESGTGSRPAPVPPASPAVAAPAETAPVVEAPVSVERPADPRPSPVQSSAAWPPVIGERAPGPERPASVASVDLAPPSEEAAERPAEASRAAGPATDGGGPAKRAGRADLLPDVATVRVAPVRRYFEQARLNVHVYSDAPAERFVLVNLRRYAEGDELEGGVRIAEIAPEGVVLDIDGAAYFWSPK